MKNTTPLVSIIIPNFNRAHYLKEALASVINQSYSNWEVIVIDDGSTDDSKQTITTLAKDELRIRWIARQKKPKGAAHCRNIGIEHAKGKYLIFLDSDDLLATHCLSQRLSVIEADHKLDFAVFKMQFFKQLPGDHQQLWNLKNKDNDLQRFLNLDSVWQTTGPIWKRSAVKKIGGFNEDLHCWQDLDIHLKALFAKLRYSVNYQLPVDCYYRRDAANTISQTNMNDTAKLNSKAVLYHWAKPLAQNLDFSTHAMLQHICVSALYGHKINFFNTFFKTEKDKLNAGIKLKLQLLKWIKIGRLDRIRIVNKLYQQILASCVTESLIGQYTEL